MADEKINPSARKKVDLDRQSIVLDGDERIHVSSLCDFGNKEYTISKLYDDVTTYYEGFLRGERVSNDGPCLGYRPDGDSPYKWMSYSQVRRKAHYFGSALVEKGFTATNDSMIGIFSQNRPEWVISDLGCMAFSMVTVPLYSTLGPKGYEYIINLTDIKLIVVDDMEKASSLLSQIDKLPTLKHIVIMDSPISDEVNDQARKANIAVVTFDEMLTLGENNPHDPQPCKPDDLALIRFTSGTTGVPKGAMTTHKGIVANVSAIYSSIIRFHSCAPGSVSISYLPLAHAYEHTLDGMLFLHGCSIGFFRGDVKTLVNDMQVLKPDIFPSVPRLANKLYDKIMGGVNSSSFIKRSLFNLAYRLKLGDAMRGIFRRDTWCDYLVFSKVQALLGGNVTWMITGSAPIAPEALEFFRVVFGVQICEAYGQTECVAGAACTVPGETVAGHVGCPIPCNMMKVVDVPEMGYYAANDKGEVCVKGPNVFKGYYKNKEKTDEALDADGWLHTGDIGQWLPNGTLKIIDRKKHIYKLAQGEYVAPEKIETVITRSGLIAQAFVYGESLKSSNVAIIVPDEDQIQKYADANHISGSIEDLCKNQKIRDAIRTELSNVSNAGNLCGFEKVREFSLQPEQFSIENGLLTPTMKNKRVAIKERYQAEIDDMYSRVQ
ncbi:long-chain-fatty-acid--CoA ligase 1-like [Lytechinus variegatus]|uniref:long-chain-fatty-acid--CoA ligase 1-like n=1 Tax=Lytechinus variegatus TaxID=7654 RepID=UPI001BB2465E|nr:long-chain-fatty-acid--CoA ligase 1-like [Lytechinus variegatus]